MGISDAHTVLEPHRGTAIFSSFLLTIVLFHVFIFMFLSLLTVLFLFLGAFILWVNNLKWTADLILLFPDSLYTPLAGPYSLESVVKTY